MDKLPKSKDKQIEDLQGQIVIIKDDNEKRLKRIVDNQKDEINDYKRKLQEIEFRSHKALDDLERQFKESWAWRTGRFQTTTVNKFLDIIIMPFKYFAKSGISTQNNDLITSEKQASATEKSKKGINKKPNKKISFNLDSSKRNVCCIFDTFTRNCFEPEFNILSPSPDNWKTILNNYHVDALFVESAWHGNNDTWEYRIGKYAGDRLKPIKELVSECKKKRIPTIFWNKEDPVHFDKFVETARLFDFIFTSDADCIPKYIEHARHSNVWALPFAAQTNIHNPIQKGSRDGNVCFAGTYHASRYMERQMDIELLLKPALKYNIDIYDRMYVPNGKNLEQYRFPDIYQAYIKGKLEYDEMVDAYRKYKVFLNVNSVKYSPTMFARRVFELLACGTPVISSFSKGIINILGEKTVFIAEKEDDTTRYFDKLLLDDYFWWQSSLNGIRTVMQQHTYKHRTKQIFNSVGLKTDEEQEVSFLVVVKATSGQQAKYLKSLLDRQIYQKFDVIILLPANDSLNEVDKAEIKTVLDSYSPLFIDSSSKAYQLNNKQYVVLFSLDHYYGKNYLLDYALAVEYSHSEVIGKKTYLKRSTSKYPELIDKSSEFQYVDSVLAATLVFAPKNFNHGFVNDLFITDYYSKPGILSIDPYNFIANGSDANKEHKEYCEI